MDEDNKHWREQLIEDYPGALIRLATVRADDAKHYLLFGFIELIPFDMTVPESWVAGTQPWAIPGYRDYTCAFSVTKYSTPEALDWYESAANGKILIGHKNKITVEVVPLLDEPRYGGFCVGVTVPFIFPWHDGPRVHRQVPMVEMPLPVRKLGNSAELRGWLQSNLGFDPFQYDEWLGGVALVAPDPICSAIAVFPSDSRDDGGETLTISATPRRSAQRGVSDLSTLSIVVAERRINGWSTVKTVQCKTDGYHTIDYPQNCKEIGHAVVCRQRGLLRFVEPTSWIEQIGIGLNLVSGQRIVQVPSGGRRKPETAYSIHHQVTGSNILVGEAVSDAARRRLLRLQERSRARIERSRVPQKIFGTTSAKPSNQEIESRKKEAENFVAELIGTAHKRVILVDPFFGPREARLFGLRNPHQDVIVRILTGQRGLEGAAPDASPGTQLGDIFVKDIAYLAQTDGVQAIQVRVMPGGRDSSIHDRYLIVDNNVWHCGPSFNELGERVGVMVLLRDSLAVRRLVNKTWVRSTPLPEFWTEYKSRQDSEGDNRSVRRFSRKVFTRLISWMGLRALNKKYVEVRG